MGKKWLLSFIAFMSSCRMNQSILHCTNRYDYEDDVEPALPYAKSSPKRCESVREQYPVCGKNITVLYYSHPPYVIPGKNGSNPNGLLPDILKLALRVCCYGCETISFIGPTKFSKILKTSNNSMMKMPFQTAHSSPTLFDTDFIPITKVPGVSFLAKIVTNRREAYTQHLWKCAFNAWPFCAITVFIAFVSGCIMWGLDAFMSDNAFPREFPKGAFEGFWWAIITMATVGYGDRTPKSFVAKVFAIIWILTGITVFSMYTAVLTNSLHTEVYSFRHENFIGKEVGVLSLTGADKAAVYREQGKVVKFKNISAMREALMTDKVHGVALDDYIARYHVRNLKRHVRNIKRHHYVKEIMNSYGALSFDANLTSFLRSFFRTNEDSNDAIVSHISSNYLVKRDFVDAETTENISDMFSQAPSIKSLRLPFAVVVIAAIIVWFRKRQLRRKGSSPFNFRASATETISSPSRKEERIEGMICDFYDEIADLRRRCEEKLVTLNSSPTARTLRDRKTDIKEM